MTEEEIAEDVAKWLTEIIWSILPRGSFAREVHLDILKKVLKEGLLATHPKKLKIEYLLNCGDFLKFFELFRDKNYYHYDCRINWETGDVEYS